jgi:proteasome lid subunit RPN8/RPN11
MMTEAADSTLVSWSVPECPFAIEYSARVMDDIRLAVTDAFFSLPRGGAEIGGILLGTFDGARLQVLAHSALECEHAFGPSFTISLNDEARLRSLLANAPRESPGLQVVGWYHSHTRSGVFLSDADVEIHKIYFPEEWQVALVMRPHTFEPTRIGFFFREPDGTMQISSSYNETEIQALPMRPMPSAPAPLEAVKPNGASHDLPRRPIQGVEIEVSPEPHVARPEPVIARAEPVVEKPEPVVVRAEPVIPMPPPRPVPPPVLQPAPIPVAPAPPVPAVLAPAPAPSARNADSPPPRASFAPVVAPSDPPDWKLPPAPDPLPVEVAELEPQAAPMPEIFLPKFAMEQPAASTKNRWVAAAILIATVAVGIVGASIKMRQGWVTKIATAVKPPAVVAPAPPPSLGLSTADRDGQLSISWDRASSPVRQGTGAVLEIGDGGPLPRAVTLDAAHLQSGAFAYARQSEKVDVKLIVHGPDGQESREVTTFLGKLPDRKPNAAPAPVPSASDSSRKERDALAAQVAKLKLDLNWETVKNKKLEKDLQSARDELRQQQQRRMANQAAPRQ